MADSSLFSRLCFFWGAKSSWDEKWRDVELRADVYLVVGVMGLPQSTDMGIGVI